MPSFLALPISVQENSLLNFQKIFPNPTTDNLTITQLEQFAGGKLAIINVLGQVVLEQQITSSTININLTQHPKGIYLVKISTAGQNVVQKMVLE